jgi:uncharacterized membrane protein
MKRFYSKIIFSLVLLMFVFVIACGDKINPNTNMQTPQDDDDDDDNDDNDDDNGGSITYTQHIKPILDTRCTGCHSSTRQGADRNGAPIDVNLDTYGGAVASSDRANARIQGGSMPPSGGIPSDERALFQAWIDQGLLE